MPRPSTYHKKRLGDIAQGTNVITTFSFDKLHSTVTETVTTAHARKISLFQIRTNLLKKHEQMGLIRNSPTKRGTNPALLPITLANNKTRSTWRVSQLVIVCHAMCVKHLN